MTQNSDHGHRKKLLVLTSTFPRWKGDTEPAFVHDLCNQLSSSFEVWVLAPHALGAKTYEILGSLHVVRFRYFFEHWESLAYEGGIMAKLRSNKMRYLLVPYFLIFQWFSLIRLLMRLRFDVVHAHWLFPQGFVAAAVKLIVPKFPRFVCTSHGTDLNGLQGALFLRVKRFVFRHCDGLTVVSTAMKMTALTLGADPQKTTAISMGVDTTKVFTPIDAIGRRDKELLFVGRLDAQKGLDVLIRAMPEVLKQHPECKLRIVGKGPEGQKLKSLSSSLGIESSVEFLGALPNATLPSYYRKATALVFPSIGAEGFGLVCVEAMACECPVIASDLTAVQELVEHGVTGLTFKSGNCVDLTQQILLLLSDKPLRSRLGNAGRSFVAANFDWERQAARYIEVLNRVQQHT